jgi:hypothetical protein
VKMWRGGYLWFTSKSAWEADVLPLNYARISMT